MGDIGDCAPNVEMDLLSRLSPGGLACWDSISNCFEKNHKQKDVFMKAFDRLHSLVLSGTLEYVMFGRHVILAKRSGVWQPPPVPAKSKRGKHERSEDL